MSKLKLLNEIWEQAYLEAGSDTTGEINSHFDFDQYGEDEFDLDIKNLFKDKDGMLGEYTIKEGEIEVVIYPDYFEVPNEEFFDDDIVYQTIENYFEELGLKKETKIKLKRAKRWTELSEEEKNRLK